MKHSMTVVHYVIDNMSVVDSTKVLCPLFDGTEMWIARAFSHLWTKCEILILYRNEKNDLNEQFIKLEWKHKDVMSIHLLHEGCVSVVIDLIPLPSFTSLMTK